MKYRNAIIEKALELSCYDAADGCCPEGIHEDFRWPQCENCNNRLGEREDSGKDQACWKRYYLEKALVEMAKGGEW